MQRRRSSQGERIAEAISIIERTHGEQQLIIDPVELGTHAEIAALRDRPPRADRDVRRDFHGVVVFGLPSPSWISTRLALMPVSTKSSAPLGRFRSSGQLPFNPASHSSPKRTSRRAG